MSKGDNLVKVTYLFIYYHAGFDVYVASSRQLAILLLNPKMASSHARVLVEDQVIAYSPRILLRTHLFCRFYLIYFIGYVTKAI